MTALLTHAWSSRPTRSQARYGHDILDRQARRRMRLGVVHKHRHRWISKTGLVTMTSPAYLKMRTL